MSSGLTYRIFCRRFLLASYDTHWEQHLLVLNIPFLLVLDYLLTEQRINDRSFSYFFPMP